MLDKATQGRRTMELLHDMMEGRDCGQLKDWISDRSRWRQDSKWEWVSETCWNQQKTRKRRLSVQASLASLHIIMRQPSLKKGAGDIMSSDLSICDRVSLCVPKTLWTPYLKNQLRKFHPISVTDVIGFIDVVISLWLKRQVHSRWKTECIQYVRKYLS